MVIRGSIRDRPGEFSPQQVTRVAEATSRSKGAPGRVRTSSRGRTPTSSPVIFRLPSRHPRESGMSLLESVAVTVESGDAKATASTRQSDLFSSTAALSGRTTDSWLEGDDLPFAIYPEMGTIPPGESTECTLKFSPKDVFYYKAYLTCRYVPDASCRRYGAIAVPWG